MKARCLVVVALLTTLVACGGKGGGSPTAPSTPTPTITALSITPATDLIKIKASEAFTATATFSDGSSRSVQATWGSDTPGVATIDSSGRATGVTSGQATIFADYSGVPRATRLLRVMPDYHGRWRGDWSVTGCAEEGDWRGVCREFTTGSLWVLNLTVNQTRDTVTGTTDFGDDLPGPVTGTIRMGGHLEVNGTYTVAFEGIPVEITVSNWETITTDNERMTGRFRMGMRAAGLQGSFRTDAELRIVTKTSGTPLMATGREGRGLGRAIAQVLRKR
jgi:hypothetical protein